MILSSTPLQDGFYMPAEFEPHHGCLMIWPQRPGSWPFGGHSARAAFTAVATAIADSETLYMLVGKDGMDSARAMLPTSVKIVPMDSDDAWARDVGPTFVMDNKDELRGIDWEFNAWGGDFDGLYTPWDTDDKVANQFCAHLNVPHYNAHPFVLEGGSIHSDGEGTLLVTSTCLLSKGRNPQMTQEEIEQKLMDYLGVEKVLWLPYGIFMDETNEHVDNVCAFVRPAEVVLAWTDDESDPQYLYSKACLDYLNTMTDTKGRPIIVHKLPIPSAPICIHADEVAGFTFAEGEDFRVAGERLAASYVNFYISNGGIILPQFGDANDTVAVSILSSLFPERRIYPIPARDILVGGGNIHCITQQIPKGGVLID